jgi:hypothetical protein
MSNQKFGFGKDAKGGYGSLKNYTAGGGDVRSIHFRSQRMSRRESTRGNLFTTTRSILEESDEVRQTPTHLKDNVRLFTTEQIGMEGLLYMREDTFYNSKVEPEYALSVSPTIYSKMVSEVNSAYSMPLGLYFCCHGGDGAHSGVAHEDFVDIGVAYILVGIFFLTILVICLTFPTPPGM